MSKMWGTSWHEMFFITGIEFDEGYRVADTGGMGRWCKEDEEDVMGRERGKV